MYSLKCEGRTERKEGEEGAEGREGGQGIFTLLKEGVEVQYETDIKAALLCSGQRRS